MQRGVADFVSCAHASIDGRKNSFSSCNGDFEQAECVDLGENEFDTLVGGSSSETDGEGSIAGRRKKWTRDDSFTEI
jgi:hypothetical protein